jgi:hypothetical protein
LQRKGRKLSRKEAQVVDAWLDLRPVANSTPDAERRALRTGKLVVFDNGKVSAPYDHWAPIVPELVSGVGTRFDAVRTEHADLLSASLDSMAARADQWVADGVDAVVLALCDAGVTIATVVQAAAAEARGVRTLTLSTDDVRDLLAAVVAAQPYRLRTSVLPLNPLDDRATVAAAVHDAAAVLADVLLAEEIPDEHAALRARLWRSGPEWRTDDFDVAAAGTTLTDGLPTQAPAREAIDAILAECGLDADEPITEMTWPSRAPITVLHCVAAVVMAGAPAAALPVVTAAIRAMSHPAYRLQTALTSTHPGGHFVIVSGPVAETVGIASGRGCLGPSQPVNLAIGRAVNLALQARSGALPGVVSLSLLGSAGQLSMVLADREVPGFPRLHALAAGPEDSIVIVQKCESPHNVMDHVSTDPDSLAGTLAHALASPSSNNSYVPSSVVTVLNPLHADVFARSGWSRSDIAACVAARAVNPRASVTGRGGSPTWPAEWADRDSVPVLRTADDLVIAVAGAPGPQSLVATPWGYADACVCRVPRANERHPEPVRWPDSAADAPS